METNFPKLPFKFTIKNLFLEKIKNSRCASNLTKSISFSLQRIKNKKKMNNFRFDLNRTTTSLKLIRLKPLFSKNKNKSNSYEEGNKSTKEHYLYDIKNENNILKNQISHIKDNQKKKLIHDENKLFQRTLRKGSSVKTMEEIKNNKDISLSKSYNINPKNKLLYLNNYKKQNNILNILKYNSNNTKKIHFDFNFANAYHNIKIDEKMIKNEDDFIKYIINNYINKKIIPPSDDKHRVIYVLLSGSFLLNDHHIKGYFLNIPTIKELKKLTEEKRKLILIQLIMKLQKLFDLKKPITSIFSPDKKLIMDMIHIKNEYKYIYISSSIICKGLSLVHTRHFLKLYNTEFKEYLEQKNKEKQKNIKKFKIRKKKKEIKQKQKAYKEKLKLYHSFTYRENSNEKDEYIYYSEDEERKKEAFKEINEKCSSKNDFYLYIHENRIEKELNNLLNKLNFKKSFNLKESYNNYTANIDEIMDGYQKEISRKLGIKPFSDKNASKSNYDFHNFYEHSADKKQKFQKKLNNKLHSSIDNNINKYYAFFILYNIPKLLKEYKNYTRKRMFEIFTQFKDLMAISFSLNKSEYNLKNGIDFYTFWNCVKEVADERESFARKVFAQINKNNVSLLNIKDFMKGMYFIQNTELVEKLELYLKALDISGKGELTFKDAIEIAKESILRNIGENESNKENDLILNELSIFFAHFIFDILGVDPKRAIKLSDLKHTMVENYLNHKEMEYLEMFCGTKK